jgi:hypothetical protein
MKRWMLLGLLLLLNQTVATAQTRPEPDDRPPATAQVPAAPLQPPLSPLRQTAQIQLQLVNCSWGLDCALSHWLLPASTRLNQFELQFDNPATTPATILSTAISARGNITGYPLTSSAAADDAALSLPTGEQALPANQISSLLLTLNRSAMPPEQYTGAIYLIQANQSNRLILPLSMSVRSGPLLPLVVLLLGIILGRLFKYMQEQGGPQAEVRRKVYHLEADIRDAHPADRDLLLPMVQQVKKLVYRQQLEAADTQVTLIHSRRMVLNQLRTIEDQLYDNQRRDSSGLQGISEQIKDQIDKARDWIAQGHDQRARAVLEQILDLTSVSGRGVAANPPELETAELRGAAVHLDKSLRNLVVAPEKPVPLTPVERLQKALVVLLGVSDQVRSEATFWFVRPLLYLLLLIGLTIAGLNTLYLEKGETFGARPISDYLNLLVWGLSADVASRTLSSLQSQRD